MAHNLNFRNGIASFASKKEKAWHGLGQVVDAMTSEEAIKLGGLDFHVALRPLFIKGKQIIDPTKETIGTISRTLDPANTLQPKQYNKLSMFPDKYATVRTDLDIPLGIVGSKYHVIQNVEAFEFIDSIIGEGQADYETVGALGNGETVFITCKLREELIINKDLIDKYLLLSMSHDGSSSISVMFTPIRVVCNNTLTAALSGRHQNKVVIRHTKTAKEKLEKAKVVLGIVDQQTLAYKEAFGELARTTVNDKIAEQVIAYSLGIKIEEKLSSRATNILQAATLYYHEGVGQKDIVGTAWGVFNGVTGYLQNGKSYTSEEAKFKSTFMTTGVEARNKAFQTLIAQKW